MSDIDQTPTAETPNAENAAEQLDETVTTVDGDGAGVRETYPPERPMGVEDPAIVQGDAEIRDDEVTRAWRENPEETVTAEETVDDPAAAVGRDGGI